MANGRNSRDVALVIKARDEATKTFDAVAAALQDLVESQADLASGSAGVQGRLAQFTSVLLSLDKAAADVSTKFDTAAAAIGNMQQRATANAGQMDQMVREAQSLTRVVALLSTETDKAFIGPRRNGLTESLRGAKSDLASLNGDIAKLSSAISRDIAGVAGATSPLQQLASTEIAVAEAAATARAQIELETRALRDLEAASKAITPVQARVNALTGVDRVPARPARDSASILSSADDSYTAKQAADLRDAAIAHKLFEQRVKEGAAAMREAEQAARGEQEAIERIQIRDAAIAHKLFEDRVKAGAAAMRSAEDAAQAEDAAIKSLRASLDPLAAITARETAELKKLDDWLKRGKISAIEHANAQKLVRQSTLDTTQALKAGNANAPRVSLFGLRPYETQNLLFQVNDIATQLASGTSLSQTLAQQGGQIFQLFQNRIGPSIAAAFSNPYFITAAVTLGAFVLGLKEAGDQLERLRTFTADLSANADGGFYDPKALEASTKALDNYGLSAKEAVAAVRAFARDGVAPDQIVAFGQAAQNLATVMGTDLDDAVKQVSGSFTKGFEAVDKLDQALNFLTAAQREHIQTLFEEGRAGEARAEAFRIFSERQEEAARNSRGPWADAAKALGNAWDGLIGAIANSAPVVATTTAFANLADAITTVLNKLSGFRDLDQIRRDIAAINREAELIRASGPIDPFGIKANRVKELQTQLKKLLEEEAKALAGGSSVGGGKPSDTVLRNSEEQRKADARIADAEQKRLASEKLISREKRVQLAIADAAREAADSGASAAGIAQAKATAEARERAKIEKEIAEEKRKAAAEAERNSTVQMQSAKLLQGFEGYKSKAYWDVNAFRVGYGSDTTTGVDGSVRRVTAGTTTTQDDAQRDLLRRIDEFIATIKRQIGGERFGSFGPEQQSALVSIAYNYGKLPDRILAAVRTGTNDEIASAVRGLGGDNAGINRDRRNREAGILARGNPAVEQSTENILEKNKARQDDFNRSVEKGNENRQESIDSLRTEQGLMGEALILAQRKSAVDKAEADLRQKVADANKSLEPGQSAIVLTQEQIDKTRELTAAQFDLARAKDVAAARRAVVDEPVSNLTAQRDAIQQQIEFSQRSGDNSALAGLEASLVSVNEKLKEATASQLAFYEAIAAGGPDALAQYGLTAEALQAIIEKIQAIAASQPNLQTQFLMTGKQINQTFAQGAANALDQFAQKVAAGANVFSSLKDAFLQFASSFLRQIAQMIIQQAIFNAIGGATGSGGGGAGGGIAGAISGLFKHDGGTLAGGRTRKMPAAVFANAIRLHSGGIPGLKSNEVPTILEKDEEVLTRSDPRHIMNGGKNGRAPVVVPPAQVQVVNAIDAGDAFSKGMDSRVGQQSFMNFISANSEAVKSALG